jgi:serine/threonine-protein kinase
MADDAGERLAVGRDEAGRFVLIADELGRPSRPDWPVVLVDWFGARAHAAWIAAETGLSWRLPDELEREKAARGVDGRICPWGDRLDATFACTVDCRDEEPVREGVQSYPSDESPYGVRGLAGNSRDWCGNIWRREGPTVEQGRLLLDLAAPDIPGLRAVRGGAWTSPLHASRSATRFGGQPGVRRMTLGLRLVRSLRPAYSGVLT